VLVCRTFLRVWAQCPSGSVCKIRTACVRSIVRVQMRLNSCFVFVSPSSWFACVDREQAMTLGRKAANKQRSQMTRPRLMPAFRCSSTCFVYIPVAIKCVPSFDMVRKSRSPLLSMNVTSLRSTVHPRPFCARCLFFQHVLSSPTHGWTKRPSRVHLCSVAISAIVIRSIRVARFLRPVAGVFRPPTGLTTQLQAPSLHEGGVVRERESCDWKSASPFRFRISRITNHSCQAKCITEAKARSVPNFAEFIDF
jgi:hypothetical protein